MNNELKTAVIALLVAFFANLIICPVFIPFLQKLKLGQTIRDDGPQTHLKKAGTPTMGGLAILASFLISAVFFVKGNNEVKLLLFATLGFGVIGFMDDYIKVVKKRSLGLTALQKIILQLLVSCIFLYFLTVIDNPADSYKVIKIPFFNISWDMGILFYPFAIVFMVGFVNAVNLTDGLDGLASGVTALVSTFLLFSAWAQGSGITPVMGSAVGSLLGFLIFNTHPAKVFMGDTGSLALGGLVAAGSLMLKSPLFLVIVGLIYVVEAASVIIQVTYFKATGGKRFFKMAPIHHHYEKKGYSETQVVSVFYIVTAILCLVGYLAGGFN
ncbi:phospho-N-acetylmuramoyl-pentapeptide-transferase [Tyzzerella sp. OttesenSCG-928-J15]|nr:phospho-N-acetylmuramoyl-pentapeptide-transferase [Tyzzerella sp. OttesenSCG-928-J15]